MGVNILAGDHHTQMLVYDFDRNGRAELILRTAPGTRDGQGNYVNQAADDDEIRFADNTIDWRSATMATITGGQEYLTVFEGTTGKALHTYSITPTATPVMAARLRAWSLTGMTVPISAIMQPPMATAVTVSSPASPIWTVPAARHRPLSRAVTTPRLSCGHSTSTARS